MITKKCKVCGRELPIENFRKNHIARDGYVDTCTQCASMKKKRVAADKVLDSTTPQNANCNPSLAGFTPRELMEELKARGFKGKLSITRDIVL